MHTPCLNAWLRLGIGICGIDEHPSLEQEVRMEHSIEHGVLGLPVYTEEVHVHVHAGHKIH